jgi:hypothetical protein
MKLWLSGMKAMPNRFTTGAACVAESGEITILVGPEARRPAVLSQE